MPRIPMPAVAIAGCALLFSACSGGTSTTIPAAGGQSTGQIQAVARAGASFAPHVHAPHHIVGTGLTGQVARTDLNLLYHGGKVMTFPAIGLVYWGFGTTGDPDNEIPRLNAFMEHFRSSESMNVVTQYYELESGQKFYVPNYPAMSIAIWKDDTDPLPSHTPYDKDVQDEAVRAAAHFSFDLPPVDNLIVVATPHGLKMNYAACAYHWYVGSPSFITYTNLPYQPDFGAGCGSYSVNSGSIGVLDGVTETIIHEIAESMTDPFGTAWLDAQGNEVADKCQQFAANALFDGKEFPVQPLWSNRTGKCEY